MVHLIYYFLKGARLSEAEMVAVVSNIAGPGTCTGGTLQCSATATDQRKLATVDGHPS